MGKWGEIRTLGAGLIRQCHGVSDEIFTTTLKKGKDIGEGTKVDSHLPARSSGDTLESPCHPYEIRKKSLLGPLGQFNIADDYASTGK